MSAPLSTTMTHSEYLAHSAYGSSDIIKMHRSFAYWKYKKQNPDPKSRPLVIGSAVHTLLQAELSGDKKLKEQIAVYSDGSSLTKGFKTFQADNPHLYCVDEEEYSLSGRCVIALMEDREAMGYLKDAIPEPTLIGKYPGTEVLAKCRPDYLHVGRGVSINVKTAADSSESAFLYSAKDFGYDWQSSFYCAMLLEHLKKPFDEIHIVVEKGDSIEECPVNIYSFGDDTLAFARSQIWEILQDIPKCENMNLWPRRDARLSQIELPLHMRRWTSLDLPRTNLVSR